MENFATALINIKDNFDDKALKFIHYRSLSNFVTHFDEIKNGSEKITIQNLLQNYLLEINDIEVFTPEDSNRLFLNYINKLGMIYSRLLGFKLRTRGSAFSIGIFLDLIVLWICLSNNILFIPFFSLLILYFFLNDKLYLSKKKLVYGYRY